MIVGRIALFNFIFFLLLPFSRQFQLPGGHPQLNSVSLCFCQQMDCKDKSLLPQPNQMLLLHVLLKFYLVAAHHPDVEGAQEALYTGRHFSLVRQMQLEIFSNDDTPSLLDMEKGKVFL